MKKKKKKIIFPGKGGEGWLLIQGTQHQQVSTKWSWEIYKEHGGSASNSDSWGSSEPQWKARPFQTPMHLLALPPPRSGLGSCLFAI